MPQRPGSSAIALTCSIVLLGFALQVADGFYHPTALAALLASLAGAALGVLWLPETLEDSSRSSRLLTICMTAGVACHGVALLASRPAMYLPPDVSLTPFRAGVAAVLALTVAGCALRALARWWFPLVLATTLALGAWTIAASPHPRIDVIEVHRAAFEALTSGRNPYSITFRNVYGADSGFYREDVVRGDRVLFGYPYPPLNLLATIPAHLVAREYRYAHLAALVAAAALIGYSTSTLRAKLAAVLLLTSPRVFFVIEQGWTEPVAMAVLALTTFLLVRRPAWSSWTGGLLLATKQYLGFALPLLWKAGRSRPEGATAYVGRALLVGAIVTGPFAIWDPRAFVETVVLLQAREPFRLDSLSLASWAARQGWGQTPMSIAVVGGLLCLALTLWRTPNTAAGFTAALALTSFGSFTLGSKAFCNYYVFVIGALCCTLAAIDNGSPETDTGARRRAEPAPTGDPAYVHPGLQLRERVQPWSATMRGPAAP